MIQFLDAFFYTEYFWGLKYAFSLFVERIAYYLFQHCKIFVSLSQGGRKVPVAIKVETWLIKNGQLCWVFPVAAWQATDTMKREKQISTCIQDISNKG